MNNSRSLPRMICSPCLSPIQKKKMPGRSRGRPPKDSAWDPIAKKYILKASISDVLSDVSDDNGFDSPMKAAQRKEVAEFVKPYLSQEGLLLYLDTSDARATETFISEGIPATRLAPCNYNPDALCSITQKFPGVNCMCGDIREVAETKEEWLGVWWDMEETFMKNGNNWNYDRVPYRFDNAFVVVVNLSSRGVIGGAEKHATNLKQLLIQKGGTLPRGSYSYAGKSGILNMVSAIATFERTHDQKGSMEVNLKHMADHIVEAIVSKLSDEDFVQGGH